MWLVHVMKVGLWIAALFGLVSLIFVTMDALVDGVGQASMVSTQIDFVVEAAPGGTLAPDLLHTGLPTSGFIPVGVEGLGWPRSVTALLEIAGVALWTGGLLTLARAFDSIGRHRALTDRAGRLFVRGGVALGVALVSQAWLFSALASRIDPLVRSSYARMTGHLYPDDAVIRAVGDNALSLTMIAFVLTIIVMGKIIRTTAPLIEEHELTV
ncbi:MAG: hypothetical protein ACI867_002510 [Glaciecola sp.]|jgi:hypothetical protein